MHCLLLIIFCSTGRILEMLVPCNLLRFISVLKHCRMDLMPSLFGLSVFTQKEDFLRLLGALSVISWVILESRWENVHMWDSAPTELRAGMVQARGCGLQGPASLGSHLCEVCSKSGLLSGSWRDSLAGEGPTHRQPLLGGDHACVSVWKCVFITSHSRGAH